MSAIACDYRVLHTFPELEKFVDLEIAVWGLNPRDAVPTSMLHAMALNDGLVVGAYHHDEMIGMAFAFPVPRGRKWLLWSHMAGVRPDYQGQGIGFGLKQFQRTWALEHGYNSMAWTFDPLQRGNANFNIHYLGATSQTYHVNLYGEMTDGINAGLPSDRLEVIWKLREKRIQKLARGHLPSAKSESLPQNNFLLRMDGENHTQVNLDLLSSISSCLVEIPNDLSALKRTSPGLALVWRLALRQALETAFARGYITTDFITVGQRHCYVLSASQSWFLYVLECGDQTLYTGITPDIERRLKQHQAGRGAAYTASHLPVKLIGAWQFHNRGEALKAEAAFKTHSRQKKLSLVKDALPYRDAPFIPPTAF